MAFWDKEKAKLIFVSVACTVVAVLMLVIVYLNHSLFWGTREVHLLFVTLQVPKVIGLLLVFAAGMLTTEIIRRVWSGWF